MGKWFIQLMLLEKLAHDGEEIMLSLNIPVGHKNYFEVKALKKP